MKSITKKTFGLLIIITLAATNFFAQDKTVKAQNVKTSIRVFGVCGDCKDRIQEAAFSIKGVKQAEWNKKTKQLSVVYNKAKCTQLQIEEAVAKIGHDTDAVKAADSVYKSLPACCAYRSGSTGSCKK